MGAPGDFTTRSLATADQVDAAEASPAIAVSDLVGASAYLSSAVDGTATLKVEHSPTATGPWCQVGADVASSALVSATGLGASVALEGGNGMALATGYVRLRASAYTSGTYGMTIGGRIFRR